MADSAPDPKLEDVLASVRRLVSQEIPKREEAARVSKDTGALVLTSKDRIESDPKTRVETRSLEQRIAELEAAVDNSAQEFEPDGSEDEALHRPDRIVYTRPRSNESDIGQRPRTTLRLSEIALIETGPANEAEDGDRGPISFRHGGNATKPAPEAPMAEDVPTLPASSAEVHAFTDPDDVVARIEARIERGGEPHQDEEAQAEVRPEDDDFDAELNAAVAASLAPSSRDEPDLPTDAADTFQTDDALSPVSGPVEQTPFISGAAEATRLATPAEVDQSPYPEVQDAEIADIDVSYASGDVITAKPDISAAPNTTEPEVDDDVAAKVAESALGALTDEQAMRLLVGRLVRDELRGELGERITRSVRNLVRREIARVLETRKLD